MEDSLRTNITARLRLVGKEGRGGGRWSGGVEGVHETCLERDSKNEKKKVGEFFVSLLR